MPSNAGEDRVSWDIIIYKIRIWNPVNDKLETTDQTGNVRISRNARSQR